MTRTRLCVAVTLLALLAVSGSAIQAQESGWSIRLNGTWTYPDGTYRGGSDLIGVEENTASTFGAALSTEYRFSGRFGLEVGVQAANSAEVNLRSTDPDGVVLGDTQDPHPTDSLGFTIIDAALNIYLSSGKVDFYVGPVVGYILYDDLDILVGVPILDPAHIQIDDDIAFGAVVGLDVESGDSGWFFTTSMKYMDASYNARLLAGGPAEEIDFDPLIVRMGFGYRF